MVILILASVILAGYAFKSIKKRRARKKARKLAASKYANNGAANVNRVVIIDDSSPPPYPTPPHGTDEPSEGPSRPTVPQLEHQDAYVRGDKPPPYSTAVLLVQNA